MPNRVPPVPWNVGRRIGVDPGLPGGGAGSSAVGPGGIGGDGGGGGATGGGGAGGGGAGGGGGAAGRGDTGPPGSAGLRKNDGRPAGSCPSTIRNDYGQKAPASQLFGASGSRGRVGEALQ